MNIMLSKFALILILLLITTVARAQQPTSRPSFTVLLTPGVVPTAIHVSATDFPLSSGTPLTAKYEWDFGDEHGKYNQLTSFVAAHLYDHPGSYTIKLTVTDEAGKVSTASAMIALEADHRRRIYVSPEGVDSNTGRSPEAPVATLERAFNLAGNDCDILLRAGTKFDITSKQTLKVEKQDILIDKYGEGPDPIINNIRGGPTIACQNQCNGITIQHITFDSPHAVTEGQEAPKVGVESVIGRGRNLILRECTFLNVDMGVNANGAPTGLLMQDCKAPLKTGIRAYLLWGQGNDLAVIGCSAANSTREHIVRTSSVDRILVAYNDFANLDLRPGGDKYDYSKGCIEMHRGSFAYVTQNTVTDGPIRVGPLGTNEPAESATEWCVIDGNTIHQSVIPAYSGAHHIVIRNNVMYTDGLQAISINGQDKQGRINSDFTIANNTVINNSENGAFLKVWGKAEKIVVKNNLFIAPNLKPGANSTSAIATMEDDLGSFSEIANNIWPATTNGKSDGICVIGKGSYVNAGKWLEMPAVKNDIFANIEVDDHGAPKALDEKLTAGTWVPGVWTDHAGNVRTAGKSVIGAFAMAAPTTQSMDSK